MSTDVGAQSPTLAQSQVAWVCHNIGWLQPTGDAPLTYPRIVETPELYFESLYFSTLTFTTLGMGDYEPLGFGQVLATANTAFGAILVALLVFVLGRRAAR